MGIHQLDLHPQKASNRRADPALAAAYAAEPIELTTVLTLDGALLALIRGQARAYYEAARYDECRDVIRGLLALGDARPEDAQMMEACAESARDPETAACWRAVGAGANALVEGRLAGENE